MSETEKKNIKKKKKKKSGKTFFQKYMKNWVWVCVLVALGITLFIETFARQSITGGVVFMVQHPLVFFYNVLIVFATVIFSLLFKRRVFAITVLGGIWVVLGSINGFILRNRMTPFTTNDIKEVKDGLSIATNYLSVTQMVEIGAAVVLVALGLVFLWRKAPKKSKRPRFRLVIPAIMLVMMSMVASTFFVINAKVVDTYFPNLAYGYRDNGFCYCFIATGFDKGVSRPDNYTEESIRNIFTKQELNTTVGYKKTDGEEEHPNIIFLQLESFVDPTISTDIELDKDAIPNFRKLMKEYSSGKLQVPSMGAGTANTEFETMTGMSVKFFGPGEYPYKTCLLDESCESIPFDLRNIGYSTHAVHNHRGAFYNRNEVFGNLGFETFTSLEYMSSVSKTAKNWARDEILTDQIMDCLEATENEDYIYAISVQGHGKYPSEEVLEDPEIKVTDAPSEELKWSWEYYVNQIYEMDEFVKDITDTLEKFDEDTVVVMYGDHLPAMDNLTDDNIVDGRNTYQTDYVVWSNFDMEKEDQDLYSYQIGAEVLDRLDIHNGTMVTYHQNHSDSKTYLTDLEALQYDILYGNRYIYNDGGDTPFVGLDLKMGVKDIKVTEVVKLGDKYYIKGQNFTEYSKINLDGEILDTVYLGPSILECNEEIEPEDAAKMKVSQVEKNEEILSTTE